MRMTGLRQPSRHEERKHWAARPDSVAPGFLDIEDEARHPDEMKMMPISQKPDGRPGLEEALL